MKNLKRATTIASIAVVSTLATSLCLASAKYSTVRPITSGDVVRLSVKHNASALTFGEGSVFSSSAPPLLRAVLINGAGAVNTVSVTGINSSGNNVCSVQVAGPLPKDPALASCPNAVSYLTVVTSPE